VPAELLSPLPIKKADVKSVVDAGFVSKKDLCAGKYAALCEANNITQ
jgi:D-xylose transport system substrate-binding protein